MARHLNIKGLQIARNSTQIATRTHYKLNDEAVLRADCLAADKAFPRYKNRIHKRAALKANISRRVSYVLMAKFSKHTAIVNEYTRMLAEIDLLKKRQAGLSSELERYEAPYKVAVGKLGLKGFDLPGDEERERLFRGEPTKAARKSKPVPTPSRTRQAPAPIVVSPPPALTVSERQRLAAHKAWATRRARALQAGAA